MNYFRKMGARARRSLRSVHLIDKCLIVIMAVLMLQTAYSLFFNTVNNQQTSNVDVIVRTSAASIFGYLLSANFIKRNISVENTGDAGGPSITVAAADGDVPRNAIGFAPAKDGVPLQTGQIQPAPGPNSESQTSNLQIVIATALGLFSLGILIGMRNFGTITVESIGAISQLRDFVSGCVGFLIGCATNHGVKS